MVIHNTMQQPDTQVQVHIQGLETLGHGITLLLKF
jgi:hypothetical protein